MGYIYKVTNDVNDKIYIGQTINSIEYRFRCHINEPIKNNKFHKALSDIGVEHFKIELVEECLDEDLNDREKYWIKFYDSVNRGYNTTWGGSCGLHYNRQEILDLWNQGLNIQKISEAIGIDRGLLAQILRNNGIIDDEIKARHYEAMRVQVKNRAVYQINPKTGEVIKKWDMISEAERQLHISHTAIVRCCGLKPQSKTAGGFTWRYVEDYNELNDRNKLIQQTKRIPNNSKIIQQYDINYNLIQEFINATEAAKSVNKSPESIKRYCRNETKDPSGYIWQYK